MVCFAVSQKNKTLLFLVVCFYFETDHAIYQRTSFTKAKL